MSKLPNFTPCKALSFENNSTTLSSLSTSTPPSNRMKFIDISMGREPTPIFLSSKDRLKLLKKFNFTTNYITTPLLEFPRNFKDFELPPSNHCQCKGNCVPETCSCVLDHCQKYECNDNCSCSSDCSNREKQKGIRKKLLIKYINRTKGFGVFANEMIKKGEFVCEYVGVIISKEKAERKIYFNHRNQKPNYVLQIKECYDTVNVSTYIDAEEFGNVGRFINHSCSPNLDYDFVRVKYYIPDVIFIANKDIEPGEELTFSYMGDDKDHGFSKKPCECGSLNCKKFIPN